MNQFCFVGICAGLAMLMLMIMPSSIADDKFTIYERFEITVEGNKNITVYVHETDKVSTLKQTIVEKLTKNINEEIDIIKTELSKANAKETEIIKEKEKEKNKILTARKILRLDKNGSPFEDGETISEYVKKDATVFLALEGYEILVEYKGKTYTIWVNDEDTVDELKEKIQKVIGIDETKRIWTFPSPHEDVLKDCTKTMLFYNIGKGTLLSLKRQFTIGCHYNDKEYFPIVEETEKVSSVKEKVKEKINKKIKEKSGIQFKNIRLLYRGEELKDDKEIGSYDGIDYESATVHVYLSRAKFG